jgi:hypothetical protein
MHCIPPAIAVELQRGIRYAVLITEHDNSDFSLDHCLSSKYILKFGQASLHFKHHLPPWSSKQTGVNAYREVDPSVTAALFYLMRVLTSEWPEAE